jgi:hypothetical protein
MFVMWHRRTERCKVFDGRIVDPVLVGRKLRGRGEGLHRGDGLRGRIEDSRLSRSLDGRVGSLTPGLLG